MGRAYFTITKQIFTSPNCWTTIVVSMLSNSSEELYESEAVVFGGSGFIGMHLAQRLATRKRVVIADLRRPPMELENVRFVKCDVRKKVPSDLATSPDEVYNLAAVHRVPGHEDAEYFETNVPGAVNVTTYCQDAGVKTLTFTSSISVYGASEEPKDEDSPLTPDSAYGKSKLQAEEIHREWASADASRKLVIARPAVIFGPGEQGNFTKLARALARRTFVYPGRKDTIKACAYVGELVRTFEFAHTLGRPFFLYNCCYPTPYTISNICGAFRTVAGLPFPVACIPGPPLLAAASVLERFALVRQKTGIERARILKLLQSTHIIPKALVEAGYEFDTDLHTGLQEWKSASFDGEFV